ncbi:hypothetical protein KP509_24G072900 [Ceratopteris richardii]|uniref:Uncharacterized protein n=1 Tax=Ceratopteris richardii TaxID=49495 RepID=A0A8T2RY69_CERRI|nr:hypothetical protein KP509_24G072900 [Ceratopteris richardii]
MGHATKDDASLSSNSSDQTLSCKSWERFLPKHPLHVLLVEEDSSTSQVVCALLSKCGYEENSEKLFDLILADAMIQVQSEIDLLTKIMSSDAHRDIPVIMMSAHDSLDMVFKCLLKGAKDFLVKPLRKNELRNLWQHVWRRNHAAGGTGSPGDVCTKKREPSRSLSSRDVSNDNFSVSSGVNDQDVIKDNKDTQESCKKYEGNQGVSYKGKDAFDIYGSNSKAGMELHYGGRDRFHIGVEARGALGTLHQKLDLSGVKSSETLIEPVCSESGLDNDARKSTHGCQVSLGFDTKVKETLPVCKIENNSSRNHGVWQSDCSAFSKYICSRTSPQQSCIVRSTSSPNDKVTCASDSNGNLLAADGVRLPTDTCTRSTDRTMTPGHSSTLHFPKATHLQNGGQFSGTPAFPCRTSVCDESCKQVQGNCFSSFCSTSTNGSPVLQFNKDISFLKAKRLNRQRDGQVSGSTAGSTWCSTACDKEDLSSHAGKLSQISTTNEGFDNMKENATLFEPATYSRVDKRASNDGSDRGSNVLEDYTTAPPQDGCSLSAWTTNESGRMSMDVHVTHAYDETDAQDHRPVVYDQTSSFREAAILKFHQKRKLRCFEKKVRYQSRKKLAEQRPRVKGQFVKRAAPDIPTEMNTRS